MALLVAALLSVWFLAAFGELDSDRIVSLPGWDGPIPSTLYSGYLTAGTSRLFYMFATAEVQTYDFTVWSNGGPVE